jgi:hypothetical protein
MRRRGKYYLGLPKENDAMELEGGSRFHDSGYAGLQPERFPKTTTLLREHERVGSGGENKLADVRNDSVTMGPMGVASALLHK